jgi:hypothetical protein
MAPSKIAIREFKIPGKAWPRVNGCGEKTRMAGLAKRKMHCLRRQAAQQNMYSHRQFVVSMLVLEWYSIL